MDRPSVILWNEMRCKTCARARAYLDGRDILWQNADLEPRGEHNSYLPVSQAVQRGWKAIQKRVAASGLQPGVFPVLETPDSLFVGFDIATYDAILGLAPSPVLHPREALEALAAGALFVVSHSGGKDSQAMLLRVRQLIPAERIVVVHVEMHEMEWPGTAEHALYATLLAGIPENRFFRLKAAENLLEMVYRRRQDRPDVPSWPSSVYRTCTSGLKRTPIENFMDWITAAEGWPMIVDVEGLRADESADRAGEAAWEPHRQYGVRCTKEGMVAKVPRNWWRWLPIKHLDTAEVFATIAQFGQVPHWAYAAGNERLSCMFCILGRLDDLRNAAIHNPELYARYVQAERDTGWTMGTRKLKGEILQHPLEERLKLTVEEAWRQHDAIYGSSARRRLSTVRNA